MNIAVTGGLGFIGERVVSRLLQDGHSVAIVDYWDEKIRAYEENRYPILEGIYSNIARCSDVLTPLQLLDRICDFQSIVHLGAVVDTTDLGGADMVDNNVNYVRQLIESINSLQYSKPSVIFGSSAAVYGNSGFPNNPYGAFKSLAERLFERLRAPVFIYRFFNVFGKNEHHKGQMASIPFKLAKAYELEQEFEMHSLDASRDFIPVDSVASCIAKSLSFFEGPLTKKKICDLGTGIATSFRSLDAIVMEAMGKSVSCIKEIDLPERLKGRYQTFTRAGISEYNAGSEISTVNGIQAAYGINP